MIYQTIDEANTAVVAKIVAVNTAPVSIPDAPSVFGLTKMM